ncbi:TPA: YopN family type III secretion system gatekeeper subunit [Escherichia coli]|nr:YopN family type III secretion system gatekeeper subunit [Escherichia coli]
MLDIKNTSVFTSSLINKSLASTTAESGAGDDVADAEVDSGLASSKFIDAADDMAAILSSFRNRRELEKMKGANSEGQERILEGEDEEIAQLLSSLKQALKDKLPLNRSFIDELKRHFRDPSDQVLVLRELLSEKNLSVDQIDALTSFVNEITSGNEKFINAGINSAIQAKLFGSKMKLEPQMLRACYRGFVLEDKSTANQYLEWLGNFGFDNRHIIVNFVEQSLIVDMDSSQPSCNSNEFGVVLSKLLSIKMLRTSDIIFMKRLDSSSLLKNEGVNAEHLLIALLYIYQYPTDSENILSSVLEHSKGDYKQSIFFQTYLSSINESPPDIFKNENDRNIALDILRDLVTSSYKKEFSR